VIGKAALLAVLFSVVLIIGVSQPAFGAQLEINLNPDNNTSGGNWIG